MPPGTPIEELAELISAKAKALCDYLRSRDLPQPSFDRGAPETTLPPDAPIDLEVVVHDLRDATEQLHQLAGGPSEYMYDLISRDQTKTCFQWLFHFKIFSHVPLQGTIPYNDLAKLAQVSEGQLKRIMRYAMTSHVFQEPIPNCVAHTATSVVFLSQWRDQANFSSEIGFPAASQMIKASEKWPDTPESNHTGFNLALDTDLAMYQWVNTSPERAKGFSDFMRSLSLTEEYNLKHLLNAFDWEGLGKATVVDVGGSNGHASIALAKRFPELSFVVQDLPHVITAASPPGDLTNRIQYQVHDFFQPEPVTGADIYLVRMILHNWQQSECVKILKNLLTAMKLNSRILIMDHVLARPGELSSTRDQQVRRIDLMMSQVFNGSGRSVEDIESLLAEVDPRLRVKSVTRPFSSVLSLVEVGFKQEDMNGHRDDQKVSPKT